MQEILTRHSAAILKGDITALSDCIKEFCQQVHNATLQTFLAEVFALVHLPLEVFPVYFKTVCVYLSFVHHPNQYIAYF